MNELTPFDAGPDPELGAALREALDGPSPDRFVSRMKLAVLHSARSETSWDVLARWAPAGLVAAIAAALVLWLALQPADHLKEAPAQTISSVPAQMEIAPAQPETDVLVTTILEGR